MKENLYISEIFCTNCPTILSFFERCHIWRLLLDLYYMYNERKSFHDLINAFIIRFALLFFIFYDITLCKARFLKRGVPVSQSTQNILSHYTAINVRKLEATFITRSYSNYVTKSEATFAFEILVISSAVL